MGRDFCKGLFGGLPRGRSNSNDDGIPPHVAKQMEANGAIANRQQQMPSLSGIRIQQLNTTSHPHQCMFGRLHLLAGMKLLLAIGLCALVALCTLEAFYFRRALFLMLIPASVIAISTMALAKREPRLLWPIIGISFFHLFLDAYATLIFLFFFLFKPLYIIMVLNWAFNTLHTSKTPSYYAYCACLFVALLTFFLFNLWQLRMALSFQALLEEHLLGSTSSATSISTDAALSNSPSSDGESRFPHQQQSHQNNMMFLANDGTTPSTAPTLRHQDNGFFLSADSRKQNQQQHQLQQFKQYQQQQQLNKGNQKCKVLNEPPILLLGAPVGSTKSPNKMLLCPSPALSHRAVGGGGHPHQVRSNGGTRRASSMVGGESRLQRN